MATHKAFIDLVNSLAMNSMTADELSSRYDTGLPDSASPFLEGFADTHNQNWLGNLFAKYSGSRLTDAERQANAFTAYREDLAFQREMAAANTAHQREADDLRAAGINPMMTASGGTGAIVPSMPVTGSVSPGSASLNLGGLLTGVLDLVLRAKKLPAEVENLESQAEKNRADANKTTTETTGVQLDNEFKQRVMDAKVEGQKLANQMTRVQMSDLNSQIDNRAHDSFLKSRQAATEEERQKYFESAAILNRANAYKVMVMVPYEQALASAETQAEKATAGLAMVNAAYQQGLIDNGYIDNLCDKVASEAGIAKDTKEIADIKSSLRTGDFWSEDKGVTKWLGEHLMTPLVNVLDNYNPLKDVFSGLSK